MEVFLPAVAGYIPSMMVRAISAFMDTCYVHLDSIARAAHLSPIYGESRVPEDFNYHNALDTVDSFFVNHYVDHHAHEFIGRN